MPSFYSTAFTASIVPDGKRLRKAAPRQANAWRRRRRHVFTHTTLSHTHTHYSLALSAVTPMLTRAACGLTPAPVPAATNSNAGASTHGKQKEKGSSGDGSTANPEDRAKASAEEWDGRVPRARIVVTASRSSGAGGQNVNKVSTKAEIRFTVKEADWLPL